MSLDLTSILNRSTQFHTGQTTASGQSAPVNVQGNTSKSDALNLSIGSTLSGTVQEGKDNMISIKLTNGQTVLAKLEESLSFGKGENVTFSVSGMSDGQYILKSLFQNTAMQATGEKALLQAGIVVNENALSMVSEMMEDGMPIDKNSLQAMYKDVVQHPETSGANIVAMNRLQIPITNENVNQFQAYLNLEHQISEGVSDLSKSLMDTYQELTNTNDANAANLMKEMVQIFGTDLDPAELSQMTEEIVQTDEAIVNNSELADANKQAESMAKQQPVINEGAAYLEALKKISEHQLNEENVTQEVEGKADNVQSAKTAFADALKSVGMNEETVNKVLDASLGNEKILGFVKNILEDPKQISDPQMMEKLNKLFDQKEFQNILKSEMGKQLLLTPENLAQKEETLAYYNKLSETLDKLANHLSQVLPQDSQTLQQLANMQDNLHFMEQMNQTMSYIQLPMKLLSDQAHGDLYVYTNKKNLAADDGTVSAFLHLDMDHLGPVDVYVAMQDRKVSTNFTLRDDAMIDFIAANINQLNERLEKKGYHVTANITKKETETSVMQEIIEDHKELTLIGTKSFDVRA